MTSKDIKISITMGSRQMPWNPSTCMKFYYYYVDGLLIDTGPSSLADIAVDFFNTREVEQVFLTHLHEDHAGMAQWLQNNKHVPIYLHRALLDKAAHEAKLPSYRLDIWGERPGFAASPQPDRINTPHYSFKVIDTPGHCPYHSALFEENQGWLFCGDLLNILTPTSVWREENMQDMIRSLQSIAQMQVRTVFCPHTGQHSRGKNLIRQKLDYLLHIQEKTNDLRKKGLNDREISLRIFQRSQTVHSVLGNDFSSYYIINTL